MWGLLFLLFLIMSAIAISRADPAELFIPLIVLVLLVLALWWPLERGQMWGMYIFFGFLALLTLFSKR